MKRLVTVIICLGSLLVVTACTTGDVAVAPSSSSSTTREATIRASRLCFLNDTKTTIARVEEWGTFVTGDHHPDPAGPLPPGKTWCTNGYNSVKDDVNTYDVSAKLKFSNDDSDVSTWEVMNPWFGSPRITWGSTQPHHTHYADLEWEFDLTFPDDSSGLRQHDYHIRRLDDSEFFAEWLVTIRS
jgi:hypothetical protein